MHMQVVAKGKKRCCVNVEAQVESGSRTAGAGLGFDSLRCFDAEDGSCEISDLRLLVVEVVVPFVAPSAGALDESFTEYGLGWR